MEIIDSLKEQVSKNNIEQSCLIVEKIGEDKLLEAIPALITILSDTDSNQLRNTIAVLFKIRYLTVERHSLFKF
ncbi:hypothetical protein P4H65_14015 [Paenibacillus chitinolyticus]|uniref:hypothetical protein n=1 Tax=Paenibacillus chitinolyticus TaxID=79263 RepID=UPI002DBAC770|nr:hypothetical protein [Paenibacillus chitinolyticus]MEC0246906.1 hypothetical protein [Paenibacillus chitinolyticus]